ncbi:MAG TPA: hypothetical protein VFL45_01905 [Gammaproteobacteria bacterium]|nr:hypothetical protein [Gammaproteobacteria bacterium]
MKVSIFLLAGAAALAPPALAADARDMHQKAMPAMDMPDSHTNMHGVLGRYSISREASGTSWQPESTPMAGIMGRYGDWTTMLHGYVYQVYDHQGGPRGADRNFAESMFMGMAQRPLGEGTLGLRAMVSLDPLMGKSGYPLLLQTGETADGEHPLIDRQHPHDLLMELSATYSRPFSDDSSGFVYAGLPGEPALGPPTFMHRASGMDSPEAPITHHWLDATHITFGVVTLGYIAGDFKFEASAFNGREPDPFRWNIDTPRLDSSSARVTWNPTAKWSAQISYGYLHSPEALEPDVGQHRTTASVTYNRPFGGNNNWATTVAWGRNDYSTGITSDGWLAESEVVLDRQHTLFTRLEQVEAPELFGHHGPLAGRIFDVRKLSVGYIYDIPVYEHLKFGAGGLVSVYDLPDAIQPAYGGNPHSYMLFVRFMIE